MAIEHQEPAREAFRFKAREGERIEGRVLVVDDNEVNRNICGMFCDLMGLTFEFAKNGHEAVDAVQRTHFDLVLMDVNMPVMSGVDAARTIRRLPGPARRTPIIAVTSANSAEEVERYRAAGIDHVVGKPVVAAEFLTALANVLGRPQESRSWLPGRRRNQGLPQASSH